MAVLPMTRFGNATETTIMGTITGTANLNGTGVMFSIDFSGFPSVSEYGPFAYHIHSMPVPADGNCTNTLGHLDPTDRGEYHPCENTQPKTCQAGDLAGKHGNITSTSLTSSYLEFYLSTAPGSQYFFGDKSVVIHSSNTTRLTCANFAIVSSTSTSTSSGTPTGISTSTSAPASYTGGATKIAESGALVLIIAALGAVVWR